MGFSLEQFIKELKHIMSLDIDDLTKMVLLKECVLKSEQYAKECGSL